MRTWRHLLLGVTAGIAIGIILSLVVLGWFHFTSGKSRVDNAWNATAIHATEPPSFDVGDSDNHLVLRYTLINSTSQDYELASRDQVKAVMMKMEDGSLIGPLGESMCKFPFPLFIPGGQKTNVTIDLPGFVVDKQGVGEADDDYHERMRLNLESKYGKVMVKLIIYDEVHHYQIDLPKWLAKKPK